MLCGALLLTACGGGTQTNAEASALPQGPSMERAACEKRAGAAGAALVDDFEDGDLLLDGADFRGSWYLNNDGTGTQRPPVAAATSAALLVTPGSPASPEHALHTSGDQFSLWGAFVAVRFNAAEGHACTFDLSGYSRVSFSAKGTGTMRFNLGTFTTTPVDDGGECAADACSDYGYDLELTEDWREVTLALDELSQPSWAFPAAWAPEGALRLSFWSGTGDFDFWVDDVRFEASP